MMDDPCDDWPFIARWETVMNTHTLYLEMFPGWPDGVRIPPPQMHVHKAELIPQRTPRRMCGQCGRPVAGDVQCDHCRHVTP